MSGLSDELVRHILSFAPIGSVISTMRVDKKWEQAARYEVKHRKRLSIEGRKRCDDCQMAANACQSCRKGRFSNGRIYIDKKSDYAVLCFIMKMQRLEKLNVEEFPVDRIVLLIIQNAKTLRVVKGIFRLPIAAPVVYERLQKMECSDFDEEIAAACPNLSVLILNDRIAVSDDEKQVIEQPLPHVLFSKLVHFDAEECEREADDFIAIHAHQLKKMKSFGMYPLAFNGKEVIYSELKDLWLDLYREDDVSCLKNCPKLQRLELLCLDDNTDLSFLPIDSMRSMNFGIRDHGTVTDRTFHHLVTSVSRLKHLTHFETRDSIHDDLLRDNDNKNYNIFVSVFDELHHLEMFPSVFLERWRWIC